MSSPPLSEWYLNGSQTVDSLDVDTLRPDGKTQFTRGLIRLNRTSGGSAPEVWWGSRPSYIMAAPIPGDLNNAIRITSHLVVFFLRQHFNVLAVDRISAQGGQGKGKRKRWSKRQAGGEIESGIV